MPTETLTKSEVSSFDLIGLAASIRSSQLKTLVQAKIRNAVATGVDSDNLKLYAKELYETVMAEIKPNSSTKHLLDTTYDDNYLTYSR